MAWTHRDNNSRKSFEIRYPEKHLAFQKTEGTRQSERKDSSELLNSWKTETWSEQTRKNPYSIPDAVFCDKSKPVKLFSWVAPHLCNTPRSDWNFVGKHSNKKHFPCKRPTLIWFGVHFGKTALLRRSQKLKWNGLTPNKLQSEKKSPFWGNSSREAFNVSELVRNTAIRSEKIVWTTKFLKDWHLIWTNSKKTSDIWH